MKSKTLVSALIIVLICIAFFQIAFGIYLLQWDMMGISYPWRYFISECIQHNILPTWNPYLHLGFPQQADPQTWYPVSALLSLLFGYDLRVLHGEFILHLIIAAFAFRYLLTTLGVRKQSSLVLFSLAYVCSGFFISNAQFMGWIVSASWIPLIIASCVLYFRSYKLLFLTQLILCLFFLLTGGYPGLFIITGYIVMAIALYSIIRQIQLKWAGISIQRFCMQSLAGIIVFTALSSIVLYSSFEIREFIYRERLTVDKVMVGSISPESLVSTIYPFSVVNQTDQFGNVDVSIINSYFGIFSLALIFFSIIKKKYGNLKFVLLGIFFFLVALGDAFPIRQLLYYLPFFDTFRFPAIFRLFGILFFLIASARTADQINIKEDGKKLGWIFLITALIQIPVLLYAQPLQETIHLIDKKNLRYFIFESTISQRIAVQAVLILVFYLIASGVVLLYKNQRATILLTSLFVIEILLFSQMNGAKTVYNMDTSFKETKDGLSRLPENFPIPSLRDSMINTTDSTLPSIPSLLLNMNILYKRPGFYGYSPYFLNSASDLENAPDMEQLLSTPVCYFSSDARNTTTTVFGPADSTAELKIAEFKPNEMIFHLKARHNGKFVLNQNDYPGWQAFIDGKPVAIQRVNYTVMSLDVVPGDHVISFAFGAKTSQVLFRVSLGTFVLLLVFYLLVLVKKNSLKSI